MIEVYVGRLPNFVNVTSVIHSLRSSYVTRELKITVMINISVTREMEQCVVSAEHESLSVVGYSATQWERQMSSSLSVVVLCYGVNTV